MRYFNRVICKFYLLDFWAELRTYFDYSKRLASFVYFGTGAEKKGYVLWRRAKKIRYGQNFIVPKVDSLLYSAHLKKYTKREKIAGMFWGAHQAGRYMAQAGLLSNERRLGRKKTRRIRRNLFGCFEEKSNKLLINPALNVSQDKDSEDNANKTSTFLLSNLPNSANSSLQKNIRKISKFKDFLMTERRVKAFSEFNLKLKTRWGLVNMNSQINAFKNYQSPVTITTGKRSLDSFNNAMLSFNSSAIKPFFSSVGKNVKKNEYPIFYNKQTYTPGVQRLLRWQQNLERRGPVRFDAFYGSKRGAKLRYSSLDFSSSKYAVETLLRHRSRKRSKKRNRVSADYGIFMHKERLRLYLFGLSINYLSNYFNIQNLNRSVYKFNNLLGLLPFGQLLYSLGLVPTIFMALGFAERNLFYVNGNTAQGFFDFSLQPFGLVALRSNLEFFYKDFRRRWFFRIFQNFFSHYTSVKFYLNNYVFKLIKFQYSKFVHLVSEQKDNNLVLRRWLICRYYYQLALGLGRFKKGRSRFFFLFRNPKKLDFPFIQDTKKKFHFQKTDFFAKYVFNPKELFAKARWHEKKLSFYFRALKYLAYGTNFAKVEGSKFFYIKRRILLWFTKFFTFTFLQLYGSLRILMLLSLRIRLLGLRSAALSQCSEDLLNFYKRMYFIRLIVTIRLFRVLLLLSVRFQRFIDIYDTDSETFKIPRLINKVLPFTGFIRDFCHRKGMKLNSFTTVLKNFVKFNVWYDLGFVCNFNDTIVSQFWFLSNRVQSFGKKLLFKRRRKKIIKHKYVTVLHSIWHRHLRHKISKFPVRFRNFMAVKQRKRVGFRVTKWAIPIFRLKVKRNRQKQLHFPFRKLNRFKRRPRLARQVLWKMQLFRKKLLEGNSSLFFKYFRFRLTFTHNNASIVKGRLVRQEITLWRKRTGRIYKLFGVVHKYKQALFTRRMYFMLEKFLQLVKQNNENSFFVNTIFKLVDRKLKDFYSPLTTFANRSQLFVHLFVLVFRYYFREQMKNWATFMITLKNISSFYFQFKQRLLIYVIKIFLKVNSYSFLLSSPILMGFCYFSLLRNRTGSGDIKMRRKKFRYARSFSDLNYFARTGFFRSAFSPARTRI
jgi:hypothetical protein